MAAKTISFPKGRGSLAHNNREFTAANVCPERTGWNRTYIRESLPDAYEKCFGEALRKYNAAQKRKDRQKDNYLKEIENSGNGEKVFYENVVQIGKKTDTAVVDENGNLTKEAEAAIEVLEQYALTFQERNPNLYLFNCVLHLDEATPHLHIDYIPVAHGYQKGMETRNSLTKAFQQMGFAKAVSRKQNETVAWQERERAYLEDLCAGRGIEIETLGVKRENLSLPEYKAAMRKVEALEEQAEQIGSRNQELKTQTENLFQEIQKLEEQERDSRDILKQHTLRASELKLMEREADAEAKAVKSAAVPVSSLFGGEEYVKVKKTDWNKIVTVFHKAVQQNHLMEKYEKKIAGLEKRLDALNGQMEKLKRFVESRGLGEAFAEYLKSLAPKTIKQRLKEAKAEAAEQNRQRADNIRRMPEKKKYQGQEL